MVRYLTLTAAKGATQSDWLGHSGSICSVFTLSEEPTVPQLDNVSILKKSNIYFDGKCVSHTVLAPDGTRKTIGVIFPSTLTFNTGAPEIMELVAGRCRVRRAGQAEWTTYEGGQSFSVPGNSSFDIETLQTLDYVCHFG
ncbi:MAG: pyrimidine/purine nucleoside phosphorylase [Gammaproteobacteria bacterium]|nr:pyrimidine/purine nucleoside phosphorylase [Gammaproteobacteria bacterium]